MENIRLRKTANNIKNKVNKPKVCNTEEYEKEHEISRYEETIPDEKSPTKVARNSNGSFKITFEVDILSLTLFFCAVVTRIYKLEEPKNIV